MDGIKWLRFNSKMLSEEMNHRPTHITTYQLCFSFEKSYLQYIVRVMFGTNYIRPWERDNVLIDMFMFMISVYYTVAKVIGEKRAWIRLLARNRETKTRRAKSEIWL